MRLRWMYIGSLLLIALLLGTIAFAEPISKVYVPPRTETWAIYGVFIEVGGDVLLENSLIYQNCSIGKDTIWMTSSRVGDELYALSNLSLNFEGSFARLSGLRPSLPLVEGNTAWIRYDLIRRPEPGFELTGDGTPYVAQWDERSVLVPFPLVGPGKQYLGRADLLREWFFTPCSPAKLSEEAWNHLITTLTPFQRHVLMAIVLEWEVWALPPTREIVSYPPFPVFNDYDIMHSHVDACRHNAKKCRPVWDDFSRIE